MRETAYGLRVSVKTPFETALARTTEELKKEGFGVITTIDMKQTLKAKLDRDFRKYTILGACNPPLVSKALDAELEVGLLLPCNVVVYESDASGETVISAMAPMSALGVVGQNPSLHEVAADADARLRRAMEALESTL